MLTEILEETLAPKLRGGYYTPTPIAQFLAEWAIQTPATTVLEPSCGDGALAEAAAYRLLTLGATASAVGEQLRATELFESEASQARQRLERLGVSAKQAVHTGDFFTALGTSDQLDFAGEGHLNGLTFDTVIGNPPFIRYQFFPEEQRQRAFQEMKQAGMNPSRLTNAWVPFLVAGAQRLKANGRLAMVIPAELLQVGYAAETRAFLARYFTAITIVTFRKLVFDGIQQEVVLLLAERGDTAAHVIDILELEDATELADLAQRIQAHRSHKPLTAAKDKWTLYFLENKEIELIQLLSARTDIPRLGDFARVEVGVVTGNNDFFVQREADVVSRGLRQYTIPLAGRTAQLPGLIYTNEEHAAQCHTNAGCWLLRLPSSDRATLSKDVQQYIQTGEEQGVHTGYKCRIRPHWYSVPSLWVPDAFLYRQIYKAPKMVANLAGATSTDTVHRVGLRQPLDITQLAASFSNVLTFAFAEIVGRSYGGGVLELEPREALHLPIPFFSDSQLDVTELDALERANNTEAILAITGRVLHDKLGLDATDQSRLYAIWRKFSDRRLNRKSGPRKKKETL